VTLSDEHRLRVLENRVPKKIFGLMRDEATRRWRKWHNEELCDLYCSPSIMNCQVEEDEVYGVFSVNEREEECV
jgi:hypothetical protein